MKKIFHTFLFALLFSFVAFSTKAADFSIEASPNNLSINQQVEATIFLDADQESINAVEGKIVYPKDLLEVKEVSDGNSIINFWVQKPVEQNGTVVFSGIIPGGYNQRHGLLLSIIFSAKKSGQGSITFDSLKALLNDGAGTSTKATPHDFPFTVTTSVAEPGSGISPQQDSFPPEDFRLQIASDPNLFGGKDVLIFATQDKQSGIDHYEVLESETENTKNKIWVAAESPYVLKDQNLSSFIYVKAVDRAGNERVAMLPPGNPVIPWYKKYSIVGIIIIILIILLGFNYFRRRRYA